MVGIGVLKMKCNAKNVHLLIVLQKVDTSKDALKDGKQDYKSLLSRLFE